MSFMDENLRTSKLQRMIDVLTDSDEPLSTAQVQYRLGRDHNLSLSREEIEAHLRWGAVQPQASGDYEFRTRRDPDNRSLWSLTTKELRRPNNGRTHKLPTD